MSERKKVKEEAEKIEKGVKKEIKVIEREAHQHNLFPVIAGGVAVFFLMVSMVVAAPFIFMSNTSPSYRAHEYTAQEEMGRNLYLKLGCFYCHSQFTRPSDWATGNTSLAGDFSYDNPHSLGTERTGPDLSQIGGMRPDIWHHLHDRDPRSVSPGSIMPNFGFLTDEEIDALTAYIQHEGSENLEQMSYKPQPPSDYVNATDPYLALMLIVKANYDPDAQNYTGDPALSQQWADIFNAGKEIFTKNCLSCHGCSGNSQGPYARHVVTQPANLHERISTYPGIYFDLWRVSEGVPGTAMPSWKLSLNESERWIVVNYVLSFVNGSIRTISGDVSDGEGDAFANATQITPQINGTQQDFIEGQQVFNLYCAQCHGADGQGDGPACFTTSGGYIRPEPANFTESGHDFQLYGRWVWKVREGVETTNMPPWKYVLSDDQIFKVILYEQSFSAPADYNSKWGPMYSDSYARNLKQGQASTGVDWYPMLSYAPAIALCAFLVFVLWGFRTQRIRFAKSGKPETPSLIRTCRRR